MNEPQFIRSTAPHIVEVAEGSHNAKSKSATIGTDAQWAYTDSKAFFDADLEAERSLETERSSLYLEEPITDVVGPGQESTNAKSSSANSGMDVQEVNTSSMAFIDASPSAELKTVFLDPQSAMAALPSLELDPAEVNALLLSSTNALPVVEAPAGLDEPDKKPNFSQAQEESHFSGQIVELKNKNDHVRAELKRRESAPFTTT